MAEYNRDINPEIDYDIRRKAFIEILRAANPGREGRITYEGIYESEAVASNEMRFIARADEMLFASISDKTINAHFGEIVYADDSSDKIRILAGYIRPFREDDED